jgi:hypothetical protein
MTAHLFDMPTAVAATSDTPQAFPDWLKRRLERAGLMDPDTGATRRARARHCERCHKAIMRGITADYGGRSADADPTPLSPVGEALVLCAGRQTLELRWTDKYELDLRDTFRIRGTPAGTEGIDVLVEHDCDLSSLPGPRTLGPSMLNDKPQAIKPISDIPPF